MARGFHRYGARIPAKPWVNRASRQSKGLVIHFPLWPTNGVIIDRTALLSQYSLVSGTTWELTRYRWGLDFSGTTSEIALTTIDTPVSVTCAFWMKYPTMGDEDRRVFGGDDAFEVLSSRNDGSNQGRVLNQLFSAGDNGIVSTARYDDDTWRHFVLTSHYDAAGGPMAIYVNGLLDQSSSTQANDWPGDTVTLSLGNRNGAAAGDSFIGTLFDFRLYNRLFSAEEAWQLYDLSTRWSLYHRPPGGEKAPLLDPEIDLSDGSTYIKRRGVKIVG